MSMSVRSPLHWIARIDARAAVICSASLYYGGTAMVRLEAEVETRDATRDATNISNYVSGDSDKMFPLEKNIPLLSDGSNIVLIPT